MHACAAGDSIQQEEEDGQAEAGDGNSEEAGAQREGGFHPGLCSYPAAARPSGDLFFLSVILYKSIVAEWDAGVIVEDLGVLNGRDDDQCIRTWSALVL